MGHIILPGVAGLFGCQLASRRCSDKPSRALPHSPPQRGAGQWLEAQVVQWDPRGHQLCLEGLQHVVVSLKEKLLMVNPKPGSSLA